MINSTKVIEILEIVGISFESCVFGGRFTCA